MHQILSCLFEAPDKHATLRRILLEIFLPANITKANVIKRDTHLFGPNPPLSFYLFLVHAADVEALISLSPYGKKPIRENDSNATVRPVVEEFTYEDWAKKTDVEKKALLRVSPYPIALTAEVLAKSVLLQNLQLEFKCRIARAGAISINWTIKPRRENYWIVNRSKYYLEIEERFRTELQASDALYLTDAQTLPLLWGPYLAVELIEMRSWFIGQNAMITSLIEDGQENLKDAHGNLSNQAKVFDEFLKARLVQETSGPHGRLYNYDFRAFQSFDSSDPLEAKRKIVWKGGKQQSVSRKFNYLLKEDWLTGDETDRYHTLCNLPKRADFAYHPERYKELD